MLAIDYSLDHAERQAVLRALIATAWNKREAARLLRVSKTTLYRKMERFKLDDVMAPRTTCCGTSLPRLCKGPPLGYSCR